VGHNSHGDLHNPTLAAVEAQGVASRRQTGRLMTKTPDGTFAAWLFVGLPLLYLPNEDHVHGEILGVKYGEWLLFAATLGLWFATWQLVKGTDRTAERQLRAYVSVEPGDGFRQSIKRKSLFEFRPIIVNNGSTPAKDVTVNSNVGITAPNIPANFDYGLARRPNPLASVTTIGSQRNKFHSAIFFRNVTLAEARALLKGHLAFHVYGSVEYTDIFDRKRVSNFSFLIFVGQRRSTNIWHSTDRHNNSD
jgi:hypothetical protein